MAHERRLMSARLGIPEPQGAVIGCGREPPAVVREGNGVDKVCMAHERRLMSAYLGIPEPHGVVAGRRREPLAVVREDNGVD